MPLGGYTAVFLDDIVSAGSVKYRYLLFIFEGDSQEPCYIVASELNSMAKKLGGGSHFLGLFDGEEHTNCGSSDDWADEAKFTLEALRIVRERFEAKT